MNTPDALFAINSEFHHATKKHGSFNSAHEGWAVLKEEVDEMWDAIKADDIEHARREAVQVYHGNNEERKRDLISLCREVLALKN